jgi:hypothetical protein
MRVILLGAGASKSYPSRPREVFRLELGIPESHLRVVAAPFRGEETIEPLFEA